MIGNRITSLYVIRWWWNAVIWSSVVIRDAFADSCCFLCLVSSMWKNNRAEGGKKKNKWWITVYTMEMFAFSCTVVSAGHSSSLGSHCRNTVVPISLPPSLSCSNSTSRCALLPPPIPHSPRSCPLSLLFLLTAPNLLHLLFPPSTPPTVCLRVENTIIYSFVFLFLSCAVYLYR